MDIPKKATIELSQAERFCIGLKQLAKECGMSAVSYNALGVISYEFEDGSKVGGLRAHYAAGLIKSLQ